MTMPGTPTSQEARLVPPAMPAAVAEAFDAFPEGVRGQLLRLRQLVFETAATTDGVGPLSETLRWGEPSYLTEASRSGSIVRLGLHKPSGAGAVLFHCQTQLVADFRLQFPERLRFEGNRAIVLEPEAELPEAELAACLAQALTYHARRRRR